MKMRSYFVETSKACDAALLGCWGRSRVIVVLVACCALFSASARASCRPPNPLRATAVTASPLHGPAPALASPVAATADNADPPVVGLWLANFYSEGQLFDQGFDQWHSDGTEILIDNALPQPANGTGSACLGVYKKTGPRSYSLKHPFWVFDATGNLAGTGVYLQQISVEPDGNHYNGIFTFKTFDLSGNQTFEAAGTVEAKRITVDD